MEFNIGKVNFDSKRTVVIAEAGVNHLGRIDYANKLIEAAKRAGADIIKFQTYKASKLTTKNAPRFWNWDGEVSEDGTQYDSYSRLDSFGEDEYKELINICNKNDIEFLSTPFDEESAEMLVRLGMRGFKIASCDITNIPFLRSLALYKLPILLSTGASNLKEIQNAVLEIKSAGCNDIGIMQCTLCYPTDIDDANLAAIQTIKNFFPEYPIGFSDHTLGTLIPSASVLLGVSFIEKHFTFDKSLPESADHWLSLDESELQEMVESIRILERAIGSSVKDKKPCEESTFKYARRSVVANKNISAGSLIQRQDLTCKRPGTGLPPIYIDRIVGSKALRDISEDSIIAVDDFS